MTITLLQILLLCAIPIIVLLSVGTKRFRAEKNAYIKAKQDYLNIKKVGNDK